MSDLSLHYKVLKQFLDISDDTPRSKTTSSRATRAREKLLKLSPAQFKELSTDVYDELRRRIDESRGEPDYLLPKSSFHPKRNQARQKLSSLPQTRFKDLVSDISYEIERRDLHKQETAPAADHESTHQSVDHSNVGADDSHRSAQSDMQNHSIGLQSKTVVPTKANMDWLSDDEEEDEKQAAEREVEDAKTVDEIIPNGTTKEVLDPSDSHQEQLAALELEKSQLEEKYRLLTEDYEYSTRQSKQLSNEVEELSEQKAKLQAQNEELETKLHTQKEELGAALQDSQAKLKEHTSAKDRSLASPDVLKELESLKTANAALRLENQSIKRMSTRSDASSPSKNRDVSFSSHQAPSSNVKRDLESILEKLEQPVKVPKAASVTSLKSESEYWQKKYENARTNQISSKLSQSIQAPELKQFFASSGLISQEIVAKFNSQLESLITAVDKESLQPDLYFDMMSQLAVTANKIATDGDNGLLNSNEQSIFLRESISYSLTTARYHAVYSTLLPKVVVERALGELSFAVCDLVAVCKINTDTNGAAKQAETSFQNEDVNAGVRPLRMANKLKDLKLGRASESDIPDRSTSLPQDTVTTGSNGGLKTSTIPQSTRSPESPQSKKLPESTRNGQASPNNHSNQSTPTRSKVTERLRMFESPTNSPPQASAKDRDLNSGPKPVTTNYDIDDLNAEPEQALPKTTTASTVATSGSIKGKGLFQSIRDRLNGDSLKDKNASTASKDREVSLNSRPSDGTAKQAPDQTVKLEEAPKQIVVPVATNLNDLPVATTEEEGNTSINDSYSKTHKPAESVDSTMIETPKQASFMNIQKKAVNMVPVEKPREDKPKKVNYLNKVETIHSVPPQNNSEDEYSDEDDEDDSENEESKQARERQEYRKSMAAATFNVDLFDIDDPDNTLTQVLLYLEHQTVQVIATIQSLLSAIKRPNASRGELREKSQAITEVISQMTEATNTSMNQTRNAQLKEHGKWVVTNLEDCSHRMNILCRPNSEKGDSSFADKNFKQRLAGISFDIAKCTKELVKSVEEASLKEEIANLNARISQGEFEA